jgi:ElaB/YqjD/DUF883 family membrane-anchored ribosome-binding protein
MTEIAAEKFAAFVTKTVDQIGDAAAEEIEKIANQIEVEARQKADKLRQMADSFRAQTRLAASVVNNHCAKSTDIFTSIEALHSRVAKDIPLDDLKRLAATRPNGERDGEA